ncbi:hydantoin racemase [Hoylesella loescheii]|nr:hydantoin racemase [Hoylesella loescheii]
MKFGRGKDELVAVIGCGMNRLDGCQASAKRYVNSG